VKLLKSASLDDWDDRTLYTPNFVRSRFNELRRRHDRRNPFPRRLNLILHAPGIKLRLAPDYEPSLDIRRRAPSRFGTSRYRSLEISSTDYIVCTSSSLIHATQEGRVDVCCGQGASFEAILFVRLRSTRTDCGILLLIGLLVFGRVPQGQWQVNSGL
jgi:hypothetical protein